MEFTWTFLLFVHFAIAWMFKVKLWFVAHCLLTVGVCSLRLRPGSIRLASKPRLKLNFHLLLHSWICFVYCCGLVILIYNKRMSIKYNVCGDIKYWLKLNTVQIENCCCWKVDTFSLATLTSWYSTVLSKCFSKAQAVLKCSSKFSS